MIFDILLQWVLCQAHLWKEHKKDIDLLTCGICATYKTSTPFALTVHQQTHFDKQFECHVSFINWRK